MQKTRGPRSYPYATAIAPPAAPHARRVLADSAWYVEVSFFLWKCQRPPCDRLQFGAMEGGRVCSNSSGDRTVLHVH